MSFSVRVEIGHPLLPVPVASGALPNETIDALKFKYDPKRFSSRRSISSTGKNVLVHDAKWKFSARDRLGAS
jgi:hypothetical protein